jgi:hypothetical protein
MTSLQLPVLDNAAPPQYSQLIGRPIDNTALSAFMRCPSEYFKGMVQHRRSDKVGPALGYGGTWHKGLEAHYKAAKCSEADLIDQVILAMSEDWVDHGIEDDHRTLARLCLEYKKYLRQYGLPWLEEAKTIGWPESPFIELNGEIAIPGCRHPYAFKIDRVFTSQNQYFIEDHKTTSRFDKNFFRQFELDNQMMGYAYVAQLLTQKPIAGVRINVHVIHKNDSLFERRTISFSQVRLDDWARNLDVWMGKIEETHQRLIDLQALGMPDQMAIDCAFPMNLWACHGRKYGSCQYVPVDAMPPHLRQRQLEDDFEVNVWNPLEADEEGED